MSYNTTGNFTAGICVERLKDLADIEGDMMNPMMKRDPLGYIEFLNSPLNTSGRDIIPIQELDKKKTVRIKYIQRAVESQVDDAITRSCDTGDFDDYQETTFDVDKEAELRWSMKEEEVAKLCEGQDAFGQMLLASKFNALTRHINRDALTEQVANFGLNVNEGGTGATSVTVFNNTTGNLNARPLQKINFDYAVGNQAVGTPALVGAGNIYQYWKTLEAGCCNDAGTDMLELSNRLGFSPFLDVMFDSVVGANQFAVMEPTKVHFVPYVEYLGPREKTNDDKFNNTTIVDPRTGITYDLKVLFDECKDIWTFILRLHYGFFFEPNDVYHPQDPLDGVNGTLRYTAATS